MARNTYDDERTRRGGNANYQSAGARGTRPAAEPPKKKKKKRNRAGKIITRLLIGILIICLLVGSVVLGAVVGFVDNSMDLIAEEYNLDFTSIIYYQDDDGNWRELERVHRNENREWVDIEKLPKHLPNAFIAIEDERFREHSGVDVKRTLGAFGQWIMGKDSYGGSTITQQLVKNITGDNDRSPTRKIQEIIRAMNLEKKMSKDQIIEMYMNTIYFGEGCHGVQTAAKHYFSKSASDLTLEECASLAAIVKAPTTYNPATNYKNNKERRDVILNKMAELEFISEKERDTAKQKETVIKIGKADSEQTKNQDVKSYFVDALIDDVIKDLMASEKLTEGEATNRLYTGGFKIYSTYDPAVQNAIDKVYTDTSNFPNSGIQSAIVVMDPANGHIKGMAGGIGEKNVSRGLNRATQTTRQPGSSFKPVAVYAPAIEYNVVNAATVVNNSPRTFGKDYKPQNSSSGAPGSTTVRKAVEKSYNVAAVEVMEDLGAQKSYDFLTQKLGFTTLVDNETRNGKEISDKNLSTALGGLTDGVTVEEMTAAYATFANKGQYNKPVTYTKIIDSTGKKILENKTQNKRAMSEETAFIMTDIMEDVVASGTGTGAKIPDVYTAGKTGTSNDTKDRWFMGITPNYVTGVWMGYDKPKTISGGNACTTVYKKIMTEIHSQVDEKAAPSAPDGVIKRAVCASSGRIAAESCSATRTEYFKDGSQPMKYCSPSYHTSGSGDDDEDDEGGEGTTPSTGGGEGTGGGTTIVPGNPAG